MDHAPMTPDPDLDVAAQEGALLAAAVRGYLDRLQRGPAVLHKPHLRDKELTDRVRKILNLPRVPATTATVAAQIKAAQSAADKRRVRKAKPQPAKEVRP